MAIDFKRLAEPFAADDLEWRIQSAGETNGKVWARVLCYVTARAVMERLDEVFGPEGWQDDYRPGPDGGVLAGIGVLIDGNWIWKWDGAENTDIESVKGGISGAFKRVGVKWGIGRYLYRLEESFANVHDNGRFRGKTKSDKRFRWDPPALPAWALPQGAAPAMRKAAEPAPDAEQAATDAQLRRIDRLVMEREMGEKAEARLRELLTAGVTVAKASEIIAGLEGMPVKEKAA